MTRHRPDAHPTSTPCQPDNPIRGLRETCLSGSARHEHDTNPTRKPRPTGTRAPTRQGALAGATGGGYAPSGRRAPIARACPRLRELPRPLEARGASGLSRTFLADAAETRGQRLGARTATRPSRVFAEKRPRNAARSGLEVAVTAEVAAFSPFDNATGLVAGQRTLAYVRPAWLQRLRVTVRIDSPQTVGGRSTKVSS